MWARSAKGFIKCQWRGMCGSSTNKPFNSGRSPHQIISWRQKQAFGVIFHFRSFVLKQEWARYVWSIGFSTSSLSSSFQGFRSITLSKKVISCKKVKQIKNQANLLDCETEASFSDGPKSCGLPLHFRCCTFYSSMHSEFLLVQALVGVSHSTLLYPISLSSGFWDRWSSQTSKYQYRDHLVGYY